MTVEVILAAVATGAAAGTSSAASSAVTDLYQGLKTKIVDVASTRYQAQRLAKFKKLLVKFETEPARWREKLQLELEQLGVDQEVDIAAEAKALITEVQGHGGEGASVLNLKVNSKYSQIGNFNSMQIGREE